MTFCGAVFLSKCKPSWKVRSQDLDVVWKAAQVRRMIGEPKEMSDLVAEHVNIP